MTDAGHVDQSRANSGRVVAGTEPVPVNLRREGVIADDVRGADIHVDGARQGPAITVTQPDVAMTRRPVSETGLTAIEINVVQKRMTENRLVRVEHEKTCDQCREAKHVDQFCAVGRQIVEALNADWDLISPQMRRG